MLVHGEKRDRIFFFVGFFVPISGRRKRDKNIGRFTISRGISHVCSLPGQFADIHSPDKLSDHDIVSGTLKIAIPPIKKPRRKVYRYQKGDYESMRAETLKFAKERYFNGYSDTRSVQENFNLIISFIQESADKHIPSKLVAQFPLSLG